MRRCEKFIAPESSDGRISDSCDNQGCGLTKGAHQPPPVKIYFQGKLWEFKNWYEAREKGFYVGD
jgi:hypothetical protein